MSSVKIQGNASGTGIFTVASPNSNNTRTLTLPDATTTLLGSSSTQAVQAWVNFTGSTATINASFNVSSITRNGTGAYTINFTNAFADTNYASVATLGTSSTTGNATFTRFNWDGAVLIAPTTTAQRMLCSNGSSDPENVYCAFFR